MRRVKERATLWRWTRALGFDCLLLAGLSVSSIAAAQEIPPRTQTVPLHTPLGNYTGLDKWVQGQRYNFPYRGKTYSAVFIKKVPGKGQQPDLYLIDGIEEVVPRGPSAQGTPSSPSTPGAGSGENSSRGGSPAGTGLGAAVAGAVGTLAGYIAVPPSLVRELGDKQAALDDAIRAGQVQVDLYSRTLSSSVAGAEQAAQALRAAAAAATFSAPPMPVEQSSGGEFPDFTAAHGPLQQSLESSWVVLQNTRGASVAQAQVRNMGLHALGSAQQSLRTHDIESAAVSAKLAEAAAWTVRNGADLLIGLNPLASMARDATELITGKDLLTGESLSETDLWIRGVSLGAGLMTGGAASSVRQALSRVAPIIDSANGVRRLLDVTLDIKQHIRTNWGRADKFLKGMAPTGTDKEIRDLVFRAIREGDAYWDVAETNVAFFLRAGDKNWLQVAVNFETQKAVNVVVRGPTYGAVELVKVLKGPQKGLQRFFPLQIPVKQSPSGLSLGMP